MATHDPLPLDARGHRCPVPALRLRRALEAAEPGARIRLVADDPMAKIDVPHLLSQTGDVLVETHDEDGAVVFLVEKAS